MTTPHSPNPYPHSGPGRPGGRPGHARQPGGQPAGYPQPGHPEQAGAAYAGPPPYGQPTGYGQSVAPQSFPGPPTALPPTAYASWGQRVCSHLLDSLPNVLVLGVTMIGMFVLFIAAASTVASAGPNAPVTPAGTALVFAGFGVGTLGGIGSIVVTVLNRWVRGGRGATWGMERMGLRLISEQTGRPIGTGGAFLRDLAHVLDGFAYVGYLWPLWDQKRQTFADKVCTTVVIPAHPEHYAQPGYGYHT